MKSPKKRIKSLLFVQALGAALIITGCEADSPLASNEVIPTSRTSEELVFPVADQANALAEFNAEALMPAAQGGVITVGDQVSGISKISFQPNDLLVDALIHFNWRPEIFQAEFSPHGLSFNQPVGLRLSYKSADLSQVNEDKLRIWYFNEVEQQYELVGGVVDKQNKYVKCQITHFSKYILAEDD